MDIDVSTTKKRENIQLRFQYWKTYHSKGQSGSVAFHFSDPSGADAVAWFNASVRYEKGPRAGDLLSPKPDFGAFKPPANGSFANWYLAQGWDRPRQWSEAAKGLRKKLEQVVWQATLVAKHDKKKNRIIWQVESGTLRCFGAENLAKERLEAERELMEGRADSPIMLRRAPAERERDQEQEKNDSQEVRIYPDDVGGEIPF